MLVECENNILEKIKLNSSKNIKIEILEDKFVNTSCGVGIIKRNLIKLYNQLR